MEFDHARTAKNLFASVCQHCHGIAIWNEWVLVYPKKINGPLPSPDLPEFLRADFFEARAVLNISPRSAAAICRLMLEKLLIDLGFKGANLYILIEEMLKTGSYSELREILHAVRLVGNSAVHPSQIQMEDNTETSIALLMLINLIVEKLITTKNMGKELFNFITKNKQ